MPDTADRPSPSPATPRARRRQRLRDDLRALIEQCGEGGRLPAERELATRLDVARETLRQCMKELEAEGLLRRKQGAGTYVSGQAWVKRFQLISFSEDMRQRGLTPSSRILSTQSITASAKLAQKMRLMPGSELVEIRRLRLADAVPMALETVYLVKAQLPGFDPQTLAHQSLYALMEEQYAIELKSATQQIHATVLDEAEAALLQVAPFSPALLVNRQVLTTRGAVIEYGKSLYRADRYRFEVNISRPTRSPRRAQSGG